MITVEQFNEFRDYVHSFYGKGGIYDLGCSIPDIEVAINFYYFAMCKHGFRGVKYEWGEGDSVDRERVRLILEDMGYEELNPPKEKIEITA
jgi:hypothetical protein